MKHTLKTYKLYFEGLSFMGSIKTGEISVDAADIQRARAKARQILTIYQRIFAIGDKIKFKVISKKEVAL